MNVHVLYQLQKGRTKARNPVTLATNPYLWEQQIKQRYSGTCLVHTSKGTQNQYLLSEVLISGLHVHEVYTGTEWGVLTIQEYVRTKPGTYYQGWFVYMRCTGGQNEEYLLSRSMYVLNQVLTIRVGLCTWGIYRDRMRSTYYPGVCTY